MDEILWQEIYEQMLEMGIDEYSAEIIANEQMEYLVESETLPGTPEVGEEDPEIWEWPED